MQIGAASENLATNKDVLDVLLANIFKKSHQLQSKMLHT